MVESKHTPGPWRVDRSTTDQVTLTGGTCHIVMAPSAETPCAFVSGYDEDNGAEGSANARLIAAAPDMYEALCEAEWTAEQLCHGQDPENECWAVLGRIRAAIAKAEGRD